MAVYYSCLVQGYRVMGKEARVCSGVNEERV